MEKLLLTEKAISFARKLTPAVTRERFSGVQEIKITTINRGDKQPQNNNIKHKKVSLIALFCLGLIFIVCFFIVFSGGLASVSSELYRVTNALFVPKDFGKIKFVHGDEQTMSKEAIAELGEISMPFMVCSVTGNDGTYLLTSAGEITVRCAMSGVVESISSDAVTFKKTIVVSHNHSLKTIYYNIDNVCVQEGNKVDKNTILGISLSGQIGFKVNYKNLVIKGLEIVDGQLSFI